MEGDPTLQLRVFDLNCWAIRYLSKRRQERVRLIGDMLRREGFDLVLLQEVWSEQDYSDLQAKLGGCYPFSHYFRSGVIGSGLCVFSRFPILDTLLYQYSLNGYPYMLQHGDWFCGKSVGLVVPAWGVTAPLLPASCQLHAEYRREKDAYLPHRLVQAWELAQFIRHTSKAADVVLLGGDLNMHPEDVGIRLLRGWTGLRDAFTEAARFEVGAGLQAARRQRYGAGRMAVLALLLLLLQAVAALGTLAGLAAGQPFPKLSFSLLAFLAIAILLLATGLHLFHTMEVKMLQGTEEQMRMVLRALRERP
ncbi:NSMA phosphodiesterase, partial [Nyctibius bracteatus]|nr:NSMA phosphodiesterase [Nyctibius bracteatus]